MQSNNDGIKGKVLHRKLEVRKDIRVVHMWLNAFFIAKNRVSQSENEQRITIWSKHNWPEKEKNS
jgi:hypothetical protein